MSKKTFIILLCISLVVIAVPAAILIAVNPQDTVADLLFFIAIIGLCILLGSAITFTVKKRQFKRGNEIIAAFKNLGEGIYVQAVCGNKNQDKANAAKNATSFACALFFAAAAGTGVYSLTDARSRMEFIIVGDEMYGSEVRQSSTLGYKYAPLDELKTTFQPVYKGWFARHTLTQKKGELILTGADGQCYISFDLKSSSVNKKQLIAALENLFGKQKEN